MSEIHFILTGGTIEKSYDPLTEKPEFRTQSVVPSYLSDMVKIYPEVSYDTICQIDSLQMTDDTRAQILQSVKATPAKKIIIVHGTSTMQDTAQYLEQYFPNHGKTIILTGAMIPMKEFAMSDGGFNLGFAMAQVHHAGAGIYVCMNARCFPAGKVNKNLDIGRFEEA